MCEGSIERVVSKLMPGVLFFLHTIRENIVSLRHLTGIWVFAIVIFSHVSPSSHNNTPMFRSNSFNDSMRFGGCRDDVTLGEAFVSSGKRGYADHRRLDTAHDRVRRRKAGSGEGVDGC